MNPRAEAQECVPESHLARVLEPSPPAVADAPFFADDPVARGDAPAGTRVVSPVSTGDVTWSELAESDAELESFCADRWLGSWRRLDAVPEAFGSTRASLHAVAEHVMKPAREAANGKFGLRFTRHGFGTPFFGADAQLRVERGELVVTGDGDERRGTPSTLAEAVELAGSLMAGETPEDRALEIDRQAAAALGDWFGFAFSVLEELRACAEAALEPSRVQLWPEHFDPATELGAEHAGTRAAYGASPGDEAHPEPYLYVGPWSARPAGELWNAQGFPGAELPYSELLEAEDQRETALSFFRIRLAALQAE
jgi:hypothetical protein